MHAEPGLFRTAFAVHGLAMLMLNGPLRGLAPEQARSVSEHLLDMVERGLTTTK